MRCWISARQLRFRSRSSRSCCEYVTTAVMAKRMATTTVKRLRRRTFSVSFSMRFSICRELASVHRLPAGGLEEHLLQTLHAPLGMIDGDVRRRERGEQRRRIALLHGDPHFVVLGVRGEAALLRAGHVARRVADAQLHLAARGDQLV